jgi:hypothetical protein
MQDAANQPSESLLMWLLLLLITTLALFAWRCHRAGVLATFGHTAASTTALIRLAVAASMPAALSAIWLFVNPQIASWAALGTAHLAVAWYGQRWLLPDGLVLSTHEPAM